nr:MAG TPA: hypothetical protein [Caudoviricetes sp.]
MLLYPFYHIIAKSNRNTVKNGFFVRLISYI